MHSRNRREDSPSCTFSWTSTTPSLPSFLDVAEGSCSTLSDPLVPQLHESELVRYSSEIKVERLDLRDIVKIAEGVDVLRREGSSAPRPRMGTRVSSYTKMLVNEGAMRRN